MPDFLAELPIWTLVLVGVGGVCLFMIAGYTIAKSITGFGSHTVKTTTTFEYEGEAAKKGAPDSAEEDQPKKRSITTEEQIHRTIWDWMTVLTISSAIALVALYFTWKQGEQQRYIQKQEAMEASLQGYLDQMTQMMLDDRNPLLKAESHSVESLIARVRTITILKRLDGKRNKVVLGFLKESSLLSFGVPSQPTEGVVPLYASDLSHVGLADTNLSGLNLRLADLRYANFRDAKMDLTNLTFTNLARANLEGADLRDTDLMFASLNKANLKRANFSGASLDYADLSGANLTSARHLTADQIALTQGNAATQLPEDGPSPPRRWSRPDPAVWGDSWSRLGVSLVSLKSIKEAAFDDEIGIPQDVGTSGESSFGILVSDVLPGEFADAAGFQSGDIILKVRLNGKNGFSQVQNPEDMEDKLDHYQPGSRVEFIIKRWYFHEDWRKGLLEGKIGK